VLAWWKRWPDANIGLRTGLDAMLIVLDVDVQHGGAGTLAGLVKKNGSLPTDAPEVLTGGGGKHIYFCHPGREVRSSAGKLGPGLDIRGDGGYVIAPPSLHENGRAYKWTRPLGPPPTMPAWLLEDAHVRKNGTAPPVADTIPVGRRRQELLSLAGTLRRRGCDADEILAALTAVNERRCEVPLPPQELKELAHDVASRYPVEADNSFPAPIGIHPAGNESVSAAEFSSVTIESLVENVPAEPDWALRGYIAPYAVTLLAGRPKVGKSTFVFALLTCVRTGEPFAGLRTAAAGVLLLSEERRDTLAEKARIFGLNSFPAPHTPIAGNEIKPVRITTRHEAPAGSWPELVRLAISHCHQHGLEVLVVDTWDRWTSLRGDSENAAGAVNEALMPLQYAAASGLAVLIVSHQRKSAGEFGDAVRGSNALTGGVDVVLELERPAASYALGSAARVLRAVSRFSSTPEELFVELDDDEGGFRAIESPEEVKAAAERERLLDTLGTGEATSKQLAEESELTDRTVRRHLTTLLEQGHVTREGEGKRGDPHRWRRNEDSA
jgi:DNA-binding transcriptional ArsR family regulator